MRGSSSFYIDKYFMLYTMLSAH